MKTSEREYKAKVNFGRTLIAYRGSGRTKFYVRRTALVEDGIVGLWWILGKGLYAGGPNAFREFGAEVLAFFKRRGVGGKMIPMLIVDAEDPSLRSFKLFMAGINRSELCHGLYELDRQGLVLEEVRRFGRLLY